MKSDRFLLAILVGICALVILSLVFFFARQGNRSYGPEDTPVGVVSNYILAVTRGDYERAYSYLLQADPMPTPQQFMNSFLSIQQNISDASIEVGDAVVIRGDQAIVPVTLTYGFSGPFNSPGRDQQSASLSRQNGSWKIQQMAYPFWSYDWYQQLPPVKAPPAPAVPANP